VSETGSGQSAVGGAPPSAFRLPPSANPQSLIPNPSTAPGPTYFEIITAMAFDHFRRCRVDTAVLEVGLGGRSIRPTSACLA